MRRVFSSALVLALTLSVPGAARAGRGSSFGAIMDAIATGNGDVIASELERAEVLVCAECIGPVMELLDHPDYQVREVAAWWFARRPVLRAAITLQSVARIQGPDATQAEHAADVLGTFRHPGVLPVLASGLARRDFPGATRVALVRAIGTIGDPEGLAAVSGALADPAPEARAEAVRAYDALRGLRAGAELAPLLGDADVTVRRQATASIAAYRVADARPALESLLLHDADPLVRRNAAFALLKLGQSASRAALEQAAGSDPVTYVRSVARSALAGPLK